MGKIIQCTFLLLAILGIAHQQLTSSDVLFNWTQFWHHEPLIAICFCLFMWELGRSLWQ